jgi:hypothetical protein
MANPTPEQQAKRTNSCQKSLEAESSTIYNILHNYSSIKRIRWFPGVLFVALPVSVSVGALRPPAASEAQKSQYDTIAGMAIDEFMTKESERVGGTAWVG